MAAKPKIAVLVSGNGTNLQAIIDAIASGHIDAQISLVISNNPDAHGLVRASVAGIATAVVESGAEEREVYDEKLAEILLETPSDLVVLAGWNRILTNVFLSDNNVINVHPALPGAFVGWGAIKRSYEAWQQGEVKNGGVMVHYVPDEGVDDGPVICQEIVRIEIDDSLADFEANTHQVEHRLLVEGIAIALNS